MEEINILLRHDVVKIIIITLISFMLFAIDDMSQCNNLRERKK